MVNTAEITAHQEEARKTAEERAEDIAYTINHSLACTATDFLNPVINAATNGVISGIGGCGHDHSKDHVHGHSHEHHHTKPSVQTHSYEPHVHGPNCNHVHEEAAHKEEFSEHAKKAAKGLFTKEWRENTKLSLKQSFSKDRIVQWLKGEFIGDFGAVPLTIGVQRLFPSVMKGIRKITEPLVAPIFRFGIERSSKKWAAKNQVEVGSEEYKEHVKNSYEHEMKHVPLAVVWTSFSLALNVAYQKYSDIQKMGVAKARSVTELALSAMGGILVTSGLVAAWRSMASNKARKWDHSISDSVILPTTKLVGKAFGVDEAAVDRMAEKEKLREEKDWGGRISELKNDEVQVR